MKAFLSVLRSRFSVLRLSFFTATLSAQGEILVIGRTILSASAIFLLAQSGDGGPVQGAHAMSKVHVSAKGQTEFEEVFCGRRRACVIAVGDHRPVVDIGISVYDEANRLVAQDQGGGDYVAAIWYPPRDGKYKIVVNNDGVEYNEMYLVFK